jgi:hypothetical protein
MLPESVIIILDLDGLAIRWLGLALQSEIHRHSPVIDTQIYSAVPALDIAIKMPCAQ